MTQVTAFSTYNHCLNDEGPSGSKALDVDFASQLLVKCHPDLKFTASESLAESASVVLQMVAGIEDNTFCHLAAIVANHAKQVTDPSEFEKMHRCLAAVEAMACVVAGMGSN